MIITRSTSCSSSVKNTLTFRGEPPETGNPEECEPLKPHVWAETPTGQARGKQFYAVVEKAPEAVQANILGGGVHVKTETPTQPYFSLYVLNKSTKKAIEKLLNENKADLEGIRWEIEIRGRAYAGHRFLTLRQWLPDALYAPVERMVSRLLGLIGK